eukprot:TRINITY_DN8112_c0_g1_i6.p1 TRINITY_DN8112_c0_g1~~TRINITY_DN8112_c0_g1_i6.p1  ORF type:complete len:278 (-),score=63.71 TRINITY_DN8112_c0_g1_i6:437-1270(-)
MSGRSSPSQGEFFAPLWEKEEDDDGNEKEYEENHFHSTVSDLDDAFHSPSASPTLQSSSTMADTTNKKAQSKADDRAYLLIQKSGDTVHPNITSTLQKRPSSAPSYRRPESRPSSALSLSPSPSILKDPKTHTSIPSVMSKEISIQEQQIEALERELRVFAKASTRLKAEAAKNLTSGSTTMATLSSKKSNDQHLHNGNHSRRADRPQSADYGTKRSESRTNHALKSLERSSIHQTSSNSSASRLFKPTASSAQKTAQRPSSALARPIIRNLGMEFE